MGDVPPRHHRHLRCCPPRVADVGADAKVHTGSSTASPTSRVAPARRGRALRSCCSGAGRRPGGDWTRWRRSGRPPRRSIWPGMGPPPCIAGRWVADLPRRPGGLLAGGSWGTVGTGVVMGRGLQCTSACLGSSPQDGGAGLSGWRLSDPAGHLVSHLTLTRRPLEPARRHWSHRAADGGKYPRSARAGACVGLHGCWSFASSMTMVNGTGSAGSRGTGTAVQTAVISLHGLEGRDGGGDSARAITAARVRGPAPRRPPPVHMRTWPGGPVESGSGRWTGANMPSNFATPKLGDHQHKIEARVNWRRLDHRQDTGTFREKRSI